MKYIIDVPDKGKYRLGRAYVFANDGERIVASCNLADLTPYTEPDRQDIEDEVWATAIKIDIASEGWDWQEMTYREAKAMYDTWRAERDEIHVGDEVKENTGLWKGVIVGFDEFGDLVIMDRSGKSCGGYKAKYFKKTGRHFDEVEELLNKMGEES